MEIKSDFTGAKEKATTLKRAAESVIAKAEPTKDNETTVSGNTNAKEFKAFHEFSSKSFHLPN